MYVINASDLHARHILDMLNKYADDSYLIVPSVNSQLVQEELDHISKWAANNNLALNVSKTKEMIVKRPHTKTDIPPVTPGVERVAFMNILGVMFQENMSFTMQVDRLVARGAQTMYALGTLKNHGLNNCALWEVTRATLLSRLTYASQAWWGMLDSAGRQRLQGIINRAVKRGFLPSTQPTIAEICDNADKCLFSAILKNPYHVLHHLLPPVKLAKNRLRQRNHNRELPPIKENSLTRKAFISRMLLLDSY